MRTPSEAVDIEKVPPLVEGRGRRQITPTDVAQFIRLEQCHRYLRLQLYGRNGGGRFMQRYGVVPQSIPPLLTRSGKDFEDTVERAVKERFWKINFVEDVAHAGNRLDDNERVLQIARELELGEGVILFQPRIAVELGDWRIRGDIDILRMERDAGGRLHLLIADMKSSTAARVEHRLQVAFYYEMLDALLATAGIEHEPIAMGILYRGPSEPHEDGEKQAEADEHRRLAEAYFGVAEGYLEIVADPESYRGAVRELVTDPQSTAAQIAETEFDALPFSLTYKCDGCMFNEFCMKWVAERDDLSLLPYLTAEDKGGLQRHGIRTMTELAALKEFRDKGGNPAYYSSLVPAAGKGALVRRLASTWPVGPRLDELVVRAKRYRAWKGDPLTAPKGMSTSGYGSLPYSDAAQNPNLVRVYIDAQHDYLNDRVYLLGALVVSSAHGEEFACRRIVHLSERAPDSPEIEQDIVLRFVEETVRAVVQLAAPDENGEPKAPIHLIFWNRFAQRVLLDALARHAERVLGATPLYDFVTQLAAFDSPIATFLDGEIRELKNYPMVSQSLQSVAAYLRFDWNRETPYRDIFRTRLFDFWGKLEWQEPEKMPWYISRARFNSQLPLEYAYAAWQELEKPRPGTQDAFASYRSVTRDLLTGFAGRRLEALEHITRNFRGNKQTEKSSFHLPDLAGFEQKATTLAQALDEFVIMERHADLSEWKAARLAPPERRALAGITLIGRYHEEDQQPGVAERNRENLRCWTLRDEYKASARVAQPDEPNPKLTPEQSKETRWSQEGMTVRLRFECEGLDCSLDELLALSTLRPGDRLVVLPRTIVDSRLPKSEQVPLTPTPKRMLYGTRATLKALQIDRDEEGRAIAGWMEIEPAGSRGGRWSRGFAFSSMDLPFEDGAIYTLDEDPKNFYGYFCLKTVEGLLAEQRNTLYERLTDPDAARVTWPAEAIAGQELFMAGLNALQQAGAMHDFEPGKREYISGHGAAPILLVQGPPGTGKSYSTAFALFARMQGAMSAGGDFRVVLSCKTHAATDVLLRNVAEVQTKLRDLQALHPHIFAGYFDARLLDVPLFRFEPKGGAPPDVTPLLRKDNRPPDAPDAVDAFLAQGWCVLAAAPGGIYRMLLDRYKDLYGHELCDCLVLDEASQMNLPEAIMAALPLKADGQLIVVGDHRQMPPIVKHPWESELRRTFAQYRAYESLFLWLLGLEPPMIKFEESFRLHADMAEFLRQEIYRHDGIRFHSNQHRRLEPFDLSDSFVASVLKPEHTIIVIVHDEAASLTRNDLERELLTPILEALADSNLYDLRPEHGLGVVVPHRAQRAAIQEALPVLTVLDPVTGAPLRSAVDTVERFQGDERDVILVSATESDPQYLLLSGEFLLDPRRLTVALSRAKHKMVLVAGRSVFNLFSADEETFANSQLWKNLLRSTCTVPLWQGELSGHRVEVWGNVPTMSVPH